MRISAAFAPILHHFGLVFQVAFVPTVVAILKSPLLIIRPRELSRVFMSHVWKTFGDGIDESGRPVKEELIRKNSYGVVLDIGAGHGHTALYLDPTKVTIYVALEPNVLMHSEIRTLAATKGFTEAAGNLAILPYSAEHVSLIVSALGGPNTVDTMISILTLCSIPDPERTLEVLVRDVLKPGGTFVFYEHVLSPLEDVAWWQRFWTPVWKHTLDGCRLDRPTHVWVAKMDAWKEASVWGQEGEEEPEHLLWHRIGRFVKRD
ncbi:S-adenosyl-L-methionine-dependent methyltransferase [Cerioporus squamosus]|nr:S-adenosyl-L-methionine-dependent methyltransferase [Cerioporus squamosus]